MKDSKQSTRSAADRLALLTVDDVAAYLGLDRDGHGQPAVAVRRMFNTGRLPGFKVAGRWRARLADLERWAEQKVAAGPDGTVE